MGKYRIPYTARFFTLNGNSRIFLSLYKPVQPGLSLSRNNRSLIGTEQECLRATRKLSGIKPTVALVITYNLDK